MPLPQVTAAEIHQAASKFEAELATTPELEKWQSDNAYKYGVRIGDKLYPLKRIIEIATGQSVDTFHGGRESIEYLNKLGFEVEPLRMPGASEIEAALHEFLLEVHPQGASAQDAYQAVAERLHLSETMKNLVRKSTGRRKWDNVVRGARAKLVQAGVIDDTEHDVWRLKDRTEPRWWIEKTIVEGRSDRETGPDRLGKAMWSPHRSRSGGDIYAAMRLVQAGDRVIHLIDNGPIAGVSIAAGRPRLDFPALPSSEWEGMPCYRVELADFQLLEPKVERHEFLGDPKLAEQLLAIQKSDAKVFYNSKLELNQGSYITEAPAALLELIRKVFEAKSGKILPHFKSIKPGSDMNVMRLKSAVRLFGWIYGDAVFDAPRYLEEERNYKARLSAEWRELASKDALDAALRGDTAVQKLAQSLGRFLAGGNQKHNLLPWRYANPLKIVWDEARAKTFVGATARLLFEGDRTRPDIDGFNQAMESSFVAQLNATAIKPASHCIPSLMLWLSDPSQQFYVRPELYNRATSALLGSVPEGQGNVMTTDYYCRAVAFAHEVQERLAAEGHVPRDMIDVQGFLWGIFSRPRVWLGGKSYGGTKDMLPIFMERGVYATNWAARPEVAALFEGLDKLDREQRAERAAQLDAALNRLGEKRALSAFMELVVADDSLLMAKSTYFDQRTKKSVFRVYATARTKAGYSFDADGVGHAVPATWLSQPDFASETPPALYPKVNGTLDSLPIADTLDLLGSPIEASDEAEEIPEKEEAEDAMPGLKSERPVQPIYTIADFVAETKIPRALVEQWRLSLDRKMQMIFQGPPGTGKTFVAERLAKLIVSGTKGVRELVQFHPSYTYEDFIEGIRPQIGEKGDSRFAVVRGRFSLFCDEARSSSAPHVLIIDEINRANLSRVFGELMYLLEYRDAEIPLPSGGKLRIPDNVFIIGTMNTADRSIALVDHALRRRFAFVNLVPDYEVLATHLAAHELPVESLIQTLSALNLAIDDPHYFVGVSYFLKDGSNLKAALQFIWRTEIEPYLEEYFYDQPGKAKSFSWDVLSQGLLKDWS